MFGWCMWYLRGREKQSTIGVSTALISSMKKTVILRIEGKGRRRGKGRREGKERRRRRRRRRRRKRRRRKGKVGVLEGMRGRARSTESIVRCTKGCNKGCTLKGNNSDISSRTMVVWHRLAQWRGK